MGMHFAGIIFRKSVLRQACRAQAVMIPLTQKCEGFSCQRIIHAPALTVMHTQKPGITYRAIFSCRSFFIRSMSYSCHTAGIRFWGHKYNNLACIIHKISLQQVASTSLSTGIEAEKFGYACSMKVIGHRSRKFVNNAD